MVLKNNLNKSSKECLFKHSCPKPHILRIQKNRAVHFSHFSPRSTSWYSDCIRFKLVYLFKALVSKVRFAHISGECMECCTCALFSEPDGDHELVGSRTKS